MKILHPVFAMILGAAIMLAGCKTKAPVTSAAPLSAQPQTKISTLPESKRVEFNEHYFNALKEKNLSNFTLALEHLNRCYKLDPSNDAVIYLFAEINHLTQRNQEAERWIDKALILNDGNMWYYSLAASIYEANRNFSKAAQAYRKLINLDKNPNHYLSLANSLIYNREIDKAIAVYDEMEKEFGVAEEIIEQKEQLYLLTGRIDKAIEEVQKLVKAFPGIAKYRGMLAELYLKKGDLKQAKVIYEEALAENPKDGRAHFGLAEIYRQQQNREKLFYHLNAGFDDPAIDLNEKSRVIISLLPSLNKDSTLIPEILQLGKKLVYAHPHDAGAHALYGDLLYSNEMYAEALVEYKQSRGLSKDNVSVFQQIVLCHEELKQFDSMAAEAEYALEYFPNQTLLYYMLAAARMQLKQYEKAASAAEAALALGVTNNELEVYLYSIMGDSYYFLKKFQKSDEAYDKGLEIDPDNTYILNNYAYFLSVRKENLPKALAMSGKTIEKEPDNPTYLDTYGWIYFQIGDYENAYRYLYKAVTLKPNDPEVLEHFGDVLFKLGKTDEAYLNWQKAKENGSESETLNRKVKGKKWVE